MAKKPRKRYRVTILGVTRNELTWAASTWDAVGNILARHKYTPKSIANAITELKEDELAGQKRYSVVHDQVLPREETQPGLFEGR
jgi:hypothetical protein